jgi:hypothetical protein
MDILHVVTQHGLCPCTDILHVVTQLLYPDRSGGVVCM